MDKKLEIGQRIKDFAKTNFSSIVEFSRAIGMKDQQGLNPYFSGRSFPGGELLSKLSELGCDIDWLLTGKKQNEYLIRDEIPAYGPRKITREDFLQLILKENNIDLPQLARLANIPVTELDNYFSNRNIPHEIFTDLMDAIKNNPDKFKNLLGINFEEFNYLQNDFELSINSIIQVNETGSGEFGVQQINVSKSPVGGDYTEISGGVESKIVKKIVANHKEEVKWFMDQITELRTELREKRNMLAEKQKEIDDLKKLLPSGSNPVI